MPDRKRKRAKAPPSPLGVLEFSSALNGDDPLLILEKLRRFVRVVGYERRLALLSSPPSADGDGGDADADFDAYEPREHGGEATDDGTSEEDGDSMFASDDEHDEDEPSSSKRQKLNAGGSKKEPSWQTDKKNYQVPFVGTSVAKGATGSVTRGVWPTGFLEAYRKHSPSGVELIDNDYIAAVPPGGVHKGLCKESDEFRLRKKKSAASDNSGVQTQGQILSMAIQSNFWMALSEWISGYIPASRLKEELRWKNGDGPSAENAASSADDIDAKSNAKCNLPPHVMTVLMKRRLPEWIAAVHRYTEQQHKYAQQRQKEKQQQKKLNQKKQQQRMNQKKQSKEGDDQPMDSAQQQKDSGLPDKTRQRIQKQQRREEVLLLSAMRNLIALCHLSDGTAREVLRKITASAGTTAGGSAKSSAGNGGDKGGNKFGGGNRTPGGPGDGGGASWMVQMFQQGHNGSMPTSSSSSPSLSSHKPQMECLRLVCTLLEKRDHVILSRLAEVPGWIVNKQVGGGKQKGSGGVNHSPFSGLAYVALRHGIPRLLEMGRAAGGKRGENREEAERGEEIDGYARCMMHLLRDVREIILPSSSSGERAEEDGGAGRKGFVIGIGATADLLSGEVLSNLTKLSSLAPPMDVTTESIQAITNGNDAYEQLGPMAIAFVEARRILFLLLVDIRRSPFLYGIRHNTRAEQTSKAGERLASHLSQLSKALHGMVSNLGSAALMKSFLGTCLNATPELVPHFFRELRLPDPKPTYRTLEALAFVEAVLRESPLPPLPKGSVVEEALSSIVPQCVTKALLGKAVQSPCALLVSGGLKLIITILRRAGDCISRQTAATVEVGGDGGGVAKQLKSTMSREVMRHLPEASLLFSIPSRFDPFLETLASRANALVVLQLCEAVQCYGCRDPSAIAGVKFDWAKLVPNESLSPTQPPQGRMQGTRAFCNADPPLQHRILETLLEIAHLSSTAFSSKMLPNVLVVLVSTKIPEVYVAARKLGMSLMEREIPSHVSDLVFSPDGDDEAVQCQKYESSLWIDGVSGDTIPELVSMMEETKRYRVQNKIAISQAWADASLGYAMPRLGVSALLSSSIRRLLGASAGGDISPFSEKMSLLLVQITTQMLLFRADPKPLAAIVVYSGRGSSVPRNDAGVAGLYRMSRSILHGNPDANARVESLSSIVFLRDSRLASIVQVTNSDERGGERLTRTDESHYASPAALRQCLSIMRHSGGRNNEDLNSLVHKIIIGILETGDNASDIMSQLVTLFGTNSPKSVSAESIMVLLLSAVRSKGFRSNTKELLNRHNRRKPDESTGMGVVSELLRSSMAPENGELSTFIADSWRYCSTALQSDDARTSGLRDFLLTVLLHTTPTAAEDDSEGRPFSPSFPPGAMFDLWALVAEKLTTKLEVDFCLRLEGRLTALFRAADGRGTWAVYQRVCTLTPRVFVKLCMNTLQKSQELGGNDGSSTLLPSLLEYDCCIFHCLSSLFVSIGADAEMAKLWDCGRLDLFASEFVLQASKQKDGGSKIVATETFAEAASIIGRRFLALLSHQQNVSDKRITHGVVIGVIEALCSYQFILLETQQIILEVFNHLEQGSTGLAINHEMQLMKLAICVESSLNNQGSDPSRLLEKALVRCCKVLPKHIKKMMRTKQEAECLLVESLARTLYTLVEKATSFDEKASGLIDNCIIACLKYGMMDSSDFVSCSAFGGCLKVIRMFMVKSHTSGLAVASGSLTPARVHAMSVTHSSFQCALSRSSCRSSTIRPSVSDDDDGSEYFNGLTQQLELIQLLLCTISLDADHVKIENETLTTILSVYNASTNYVDRMLRRLIFLYEQSGSCKDKVVMNDLQWGPAAKRNNDDEESWEWLVDALDLDRIRSTMSQFPVTDTLEPSTWDSIECRIKNVEQWGSSTNSEDKADDDDSMSETRASVTPQANTCALQSSLDVENNLWNGAGDDLRYSPGFILPLILATIEAHLPHENNSNCSKNIGDMHPDEESAKKNEEEIAQCQAFGGVCRRVCDRGGIALAIASLSSRCPSLRQVAVAICGLFLKAVQMQESHGIKSWRERPQLEMVMSSIQRGLAVRRAIQMQRYDAQEGPELGGLATNTCKYNIPMLPAVSAIFLAKVLLVLSKPRDDMYGQMNRYFLRLTDFHGAFQDCFGLPAFLSLYCSSSEELSRCQAERHWALLSLKDGAVDGFCYRIISQHHVPELIMCSFDSLADSPESKSELFLTIDVIETLLRSGGTHAANHLIKRQGFLSWLHGVVSWRNVSSVFPYVALRCRFLKLITTAVDAYRCLNQASDDINGSTMEFYEKAPLANAVIRICLNDADTAENKGISSDEFPTALLESTSNSLWAIYLAGKGQHIAITLSGSTNLHNAMSLLKKFICHVEMFGKVLASICDLPLVTNDADLPSAKLFCELALGFILEMRTRVLSDTILLSLRRVSELMKLHPCLGDEAHIVSQMMKCRHFVYLLVGGIQVWNESLPYMQNSSS